ncbi:MAG: Flp pilus assembly complex ATPase component TadA [Actinomycetota bacterium]|nr:Flp pilus assembly complex ATPase component TadA [Actinomycetota bacterium]
MATSQVPMLSPNEVNGGARKASTLDRRLLLGEILVAAQLLSDDQLHAALAEQAKEGGRLRLGTVIVRLGLVREQDVAACLSVQLGIQQVDLAGTVPDADVLARVPRTLAYRHLALPLTIEDDVLTVAVADPTNVLAKDDLRSAAQVNRVRLRVATETAIREALRTAYGTDHHTLDALSSEDVATVDDEKLVTEDVQGAASADSQPIVKLANLILAEAMRSRASDIHVEPGRNNVRIRYRVDGMLREVMRVSPEASASLVSRLKIMAKLDIAERRRPQDGRAAVRVAAQEVDLRVATMPTMFGETVVLRLLRKDVEQHHVDTIGMHREQLSQFTWALQRPQGLVIITGPTGSGKTTTLYAGLNQISDPVRNVVTLEDPVEYQLEGVNQTQIQDKIGLTFARGLRSLLRQDPDVVLVGEIRDQETAQLAMQASFTGHLVLSTLHTNDAPSSIARLIDLGIERFLIASSLVLVVSQRLVRLNCKHCVAPTQPDERVLAQLRLTRSDLAAANLRRGTGCELCGRTGFVGREGIFELLSITPSVRELLLQGASETELARVARTAGMRTLREDGVRKALEGRTTLEEILRVTPSDTIVTLRCPDCGHHVADGYVACPLCGSDLCVEGCAECGRQLEAHWRMCPYCRTPLRRRGDGEPPVHIAASGR